MATTATTEPTSFRMGIVCSWRIFLSNYLPAAGWALSYDFVNSVYHVAITASNNGDGTHLVALTAQQTAAFTAGDYAYAAKVTKSAEVYEVRRGLITALPAMTAAADVRSHAKKVLDALQSLIEGKATSDVASYSIAGRSLARMMPDELMRWTTHYRIIYAREVAADRLSRGIGTRRRINVRFGG